MCLYVQTRVKIKKVRQFKCEQSKTPKPVHSLKVVHFDYLQGKDVDLIQKHFCFASCILSIQTVSLLEAPKSNMTTKWLLLAKERCSLAKENNHRILPTINVFLREVPCTLESLFHHVALVLVKSKLSQIQ